MIHGMMMTSMKHIHRVSIAVGTVMIQRWRGAPERWMDAHPVHEPPLQSTTPRKTVPWSGGSRLYLLRKSLRGWLPRPSPRTKLGASLTDASR